MTASICLYCGAPKHGAYSPCSDCGNPIPDEHVSAMISDHNLTPEELSQLSHSIRTLRQHCRNEHIQYLTFLYFLHRKWPKTLEMAIDALDRDIQMQVIACYNKCEKELPAQSRDTLRISPVLLSRWAKAFGPAMQQLDLEWQASAAPLGREALLIADRLRTLFRELPDPRNRGVLHRLLDRLIDVKELEDKVAMLELTCNRVANAMIAHADKAKNGFSPRSHKQGSFLRGTSDLIQEGFGLLTEATDEFFRTRRLNGARHTAIREQLERCLSSIRATAEAIVDPDRITPESE